MKLHKKANSNAKLVYPPLPENPTIWDNIKLKMQSLILVSESHPKTIEYFKSEIAILKEKKRQCEQFEYTIHPMSKFHQYYEVWCFFFYGTVLFYKMFDFGFVRISTKSPFGVQPKATIVGIFLDVVSFINIALQFFLGYTVQANRNIELSLKKIMLKYLLNCHFYCDLFSSIPRVIGWNSTSFLFLFLLSLNLLKLCRIPTFIRLIKPTAIFFGINSSTNTFLIGFFCIVALIMHTMTCLHVGIPRYRGALTENEVPESYVNAYFHTRSVRLQYIYAFFKSAQYNFLVDRPNTRPTKLPEEIFLCVWNYFLGKLLFATIWIVLLYMFMSKKAARVKFEEVMTELNEYIKAKQLPDDLKKRLIQYYEYKYQKVFFNENFISTIFSENLKNEIDVFLCKSLLKQVKIFSTVSPQVVVQTISHLIPQIYLPNDLVLQSATVGDCMYFIGSGTVAVFTPSGKELCHLTDGDYFGEICLIVKDQKRTATVRAIEVSKIYKLKKVHFDELFKKTDEIYGIFLESAKRRLEETKTRDMEFKKNLFEQLYNL